MTWAEALDQEYGRLIGGIGDTAGFVSTQLTDVEGGLNGLLIMTGDRKCCRRQSARPTNTQKEIQ